MDFFTKIHHIRILLRLVRGLYWAFAQHGAHKLDHVYAFVHLIRLQCCSTNSGLSGLSLLALLAICGSFLVHLLLHGLEGALCSLIVLIPSAICIGHLAYLFSLGALCFSTTGSRRSQLLGMTNYALTESLYALTRRIVCIALFADFNRA